MRALAALLAIGMITDVACAETFDGSRTVIVDGDTFGLGKERFRILNIDAPESFRPRCEAELVVGLKAKEGLAALLRAGPVDIKREGRDRYGRKLAQVSVQLLGSRVDVGEVLMREGLALPWAPGAEARMGRLNMWRG